MQIPCQQSLFFWPFLFMQRIQKGLDCQEELVSVVANSYAFNSQKSLNINAINLETRQLD